MPATHVNPSSTPTMLPPIPAPPLSNTKHIPILMGRADWAAWHDGIVALLTHSGSLNHVNGLGAAHPDSHYPLHMVLTFPPILLATPDSVEICAFSLWWSQDQITSYILLSCITLSVRNTLPLYNVESPTQLSARDFYI